MKKGPLLIVVASLLTAAAGIGAGADKEDKSPLD